MVVISAILRTTEGKADEFIQEFKKLAPQVHKDPGAITYALHRSAKDPNKFFVYEKYQDRDAVTYHGSTPHFKAFNKAVAPMMAARAEIEFYEEVA